MTLTGDASPDARSSFALGVSLWEKIATRSATATLTPVPRARETRLLPRGDESRSFLVRPWRLPLGEDRNEEREQDWTHRAASPVAQNTQLNSGSVADVFFFGKQN